MSKPQENSYKFYENIDCKYFPCHEMPPEEGFNCLFCYCPLYLLGEKCGGNFTWAGSSGTIKDCSSCLFPHVPENYEKITKKLKEEHINKQKK